MSMSSAAGTTCCTRPIRSAAAARGRQVVPGAERVARAGDDVDVLSGVGVERPYRVTDLLHRLVVVGVLLLRAIEREDGDVVVTVDAEVAHGGETVPLRANPV